MLSIRKNDPTPVPSAPASPAPLRSAVSSPSVIGANLSIVGNLVSEGELHIDGTVQGDIQAFNILVRDTAKITGTISGKEVIINGEVLGSVTADRVVLGASCNLQGDVYHQALSIEHGAFFEGGSRRGTPQANAAAANHGRLPFVVDTPALK